MSVMPLNVVQNSSLRCERNYRIRPNTTLNRCCAPGLVLKSILLNLVVKIVLQHIPPDSGGKADIAGDSRCARTGRSGRATNSQI
jgi:hypothetical protein